MSESDGKEKEEAEPLEEDDGESDSDGDSRYLLSNSEMEEASWRFSWLTGGKTRRSSLAKIGDSLMTTIDETGSKGSIRCC